MKRRSDQKAPRLGAAAALLFAMLLSACGGGTSGSPGGGGQATSGGGGSGGSGASTSTNTGGQAGGAGGTTQSNVPSLVESCEAICDKTVALNCNPITLEECKAACPGFSAGIDPYCAKAGAQYYACMSTLEYLCYEGGGTDATGTEVCNEQAMAYFGCNATLPCVHYCDAAAALPCGPEAAACIEGCTQTQLNLYMSCDHQFDSVRDCQVKEGTLVCSGASVASSGCGGLVGNFASCIANEQGDWCEGYCQAASVIGCTPEGLNTCLLNCQSKRLVKGGACKEQYEAILQCHAGYQFDCTMGPLPTTGCESPDLDYQTCLGM